ncbi:MAG: ZIP family metal transporter [Mucilaginibacter polytrichastri]|nr:ZIP family metal transporter [Mucilaginibacter polytrichastri]
MSPWYILLLFLSAFAGGCAVFYVRRDNRQQLKLILSFSGAFLFSITVLHLIPEVYAGHDHLVGVFILGGFLFQILLEQLSQGIEHGHMHTHAPEGPAFPFGIMFSLSLHAVLEGMPLVGSHQRELVFGIALHHVPAAFALGSVLLQHHIRKPNIILLLALFALMTPAGFLLSKILSENTSADLHRYFSRIMGVVIGIFLHISTTILFESSVEHHFSRKKTIAVLAGVSIALISFFTSLA